MSLILKVSAVKNQTLKTSMEFEFDESGGTIGRKLTNTWVLPDEQRHLSGSHARVEYSKGSYYIVDTSTNGVFVNGNHSPLGNGNKQQLEDGFQLLMGTFHIEVNISTEDSIVANDLPVDVLPDFAESTSSVSSEDDLFSDLFEDSKKSLADKPFEPLNPVQKKQAANIGSEDPFFDFDDFKAESGPAKSNKPPVIDNKSEMDSFFKPADVKHFTEDQLSIDTQSEDNSKQVIDEELFETGNNDVGIPDDWNLPDNSKDSFDDLLKGFDKPLEPEKKEIESSVSDSKKIPENAIPKTEVADVQSKSQADSLHGDAFLKGLGLDENSFKNGLTEQQLFLAGKLFKSAIKGTIEILHSRAEIKNEMRMDMTTIQPVQNNPIKFAVDIDEAIRKLLDIDNISYMEPEQAMNEVYDDIASHQLAIISGIQASLSHVLKRFEPKQLITRFEENSPISASIPVHRKAKLWEAFENLYEAIGEEAEDDFNRLFGQEFAKAYDEQVATLKKKRAK